MRRVFYAFRALAVVVGILLPFLYAAAIVLWLADKHGPAHRHADTVAGVVGPVHGTLYIVYIAVAFYIATRARWSIVFTVTMLLAGIIPFLVFWVERQVARKLREDFPEEFGLEPATT